MLFRFVLFAAAISCCAGQPKMGPYTVTQKLYSVPALDSTNPSAWVWYPITNESLTQFPLIVYLHGFLGMGLYRLKSCY